MRMMMATAGTLLAAAALMTGCSEDPDPSDLKVADAQVGDEQDQSPEDGAAESAEDADGDLGAVDVTVDGETVSITPTEVRCSGSPDEMHHLIATTDEQPPLVEVAGEHFAMVKLVEDERPQETNSPQGIEFGDGQASFDTAQVGDAVVDGTLRCSDWED